ncbi:MAG: hypothetical protein JNK63_11725 [Chthonomonas sp.]|nr:hypothetical protein [Chthonomonas sp.]
MAVDPKTKAKVLADWATGNFSEEDLSTKHKVGKGTVGRWIRAIKKAQTVQNGLVNPKAAAFEDALHGFLVSGLLMLDGQAKLLRDPEYIKSKPTDEIIKHTDFISSRHDRAVILAQSLGGSQPGTPLPEPAIPSAEDQGERHEVAIPELVGEEQES